MSGCLKKTGPTRLNSKHQKFYLAITLSACLSFTVQADLTDLQFSNALEASAARANQQTYDRLIQLGCTDQQAAAAGNCTGTAFQLFSRVRELVHSSNQIVNNGWGSTLFSLDLDLEDLGFALRWTAGEEFASQGQISNEFAGGQLANLSARLKSLRRGSRGFGFALNGVGNSANIAGVDPVQQTSGGAASADQATQSGRWGGFINADFGYGKKGATVFEDAYDFNGTKVTFGADYRFNDQWTFGLVGGIIEQEIDFDSNLSIVDGGMETNGLSLLPYFLFQSDNFYGSFSLGWQTQEIDMSRFIKYPSLNPDVASLNTEATSSTDATVISLFGEVGYTYNINAFVIEPFISLSNINTSIDGFKETDLNDTALDLTIGKQKFDSLEASIGVKLQYAYTPSWGVLIPYVDLQFHNQFEENSRNISSSFTNQSALALDDGNFNLPTDQLDTAYYSYNVGVSVVLRGDVYIDGDNNSSGSMQAFVNYRSIEKIKNYEEQTVTVGFRYGF